MSRRFNITLNDETFDAISQIAEEHRMVESEIVREGIQLILEQKYGIKVDTRIRRGRKPGYSPKKKKKQDSASD